MYIINGSLGFESKKKALVAFHSTVIDNKQYINAYVNDTDILFTVKGTDLLSIMRTVDDYLAALELSIKIMEVG
ncbi:MAG: hypothetical protein M1481_06505 [Candidatus Thermoplasmatota archaeon]|jgi:hypothetical protein|nr:hypothetical protein [Candidatus Thermoplasmatota archaeon]